MDKKEEAVSAIGKLPIETGSTGNVGSNPAIASSAPAYFVVKPCIHMAHKYEPMATVAAYKCVYCGDVQDAFLFDKDKLP